MKGADSIVDGPAVYRVKVEGHIPMNWSEGLLGMNITTADSEDSSISIIVGRLPDQAALAGIVNTLCEQRFAVLSVECLEKG